MIDYLTFALSVFTGFFAIMHPIANIPIFLTLVQDADTKTKNEINKKATITAFINYCNRKNNEINNWN
ncbi:MAG: MarC family protein [Prolixibacteraceae bacterium]